MGSERRQAHVITPGDHFSPSTGSAIPSVVHGLAAASERRPVVLVAEGTYPDRYSSADVIEYPMLESPHGAARWTRAVDVALGRSGLPRPWARRVWRQTVADQRGWEPSFVIGHNAVPLLRHVQEPHLPVLYAHNDLLGNYSRHEAAHALASAHRIIAVSNFTAGRLCDRLPTAVQERVKVVHNGVDVEQFAVPRTLRPERLRVGFIGRVIPDKGAHILLQAVSRLGRDDLSVTVVGSAGFSAVEPLTKYEQELRRLAGKAHGLVEFLPFQPRDIVPRLLASFDVVVVPSVWPEPFSLIVLEAMAAGAVVVASDTGGIPEAAGGAAILTGPGNPSELAEALAGVLDSASLLEATAAAGRRRVEAATWAHSVSRLEDALV